MRRNEAEEPIFQFVTNAQGHQRLAIFGFTRDHFSLDSDVRVQEILDQTEKATSATPEGRRLTIDLKIIAQQRMAKAQAQGDQKGVQEAQKNIERFQKSLY
jgi:hypothetical protein